MVEAKTLLLNTSDQSGAAKLGESTHVVKKGATYWFTGLSGCGKSTLSVALKAKIDALVGDNKKVFILDGDVIRTGLNNNLGFTAEDRAENIRRVGEVAKLFAMSGQIVFVAFISPYTAGRDGARDMHAKAGLDFNEVHISASLEVCESRDVKGLYKKAREGVIKNFTGISDPYEAPANPELTIDTGALTLDQCQAIMLKHMQDTGVLAQKNASRLVHSLVKEPTEDEAKEAEGLPSIELDEHQAQYLQTIGDGWAFPLNRFMNEMELLQVLHMHTILDEVGGRHLLSVPITQHVTGEQKAALKDAKKVALKFRGVIYAVINEPTFFDNRKEEIISRTFGTFSTKHPKAETIMAQGDFLISGASMRFFAKVKFNDGIDHFRLNPAEIAGRLAEKGADAVYAFQVRNPLHNGHVLLLKDTREQLIKLGFKNPILLLHPLGGWCKDDDVPTDVRMHQHQALLDDGTLNPEHTVLAVWPSPMYYGGPTEVLWHASSRVGCGITHFITGRDPAGVKHPEIADKDLYDVWHGQKLLVNQKALLNGVEVLPFKVAAYNKVNQRMEFFNPPASNAADFDFISGSRMRKMAKDGEALPPGFMSEKGWEVLAAYYKSL
jgi:3'-phosphoadenosine 5'-phosphosulfate synthase